ncbi:nuclear transport factor 2 family protein [Paenibacillus sp. Root444D2]|uniref:nuclear transport factor 2 family protein n=1 Tax=Paenibacillus sp. Root444D2 TaxID=1736538 RepID=UPI000710D982|nr:nuclear transport factor 2 family protein [Paenibacillus sp. Root444D2]KQX44658.1 hypothetical protein ASD40_21930 [Paenibacillus sp. Root444D2]
MREEKSLPEIVSDYIKASNEHDLESYMNTFADNGIIIEESIGSMLVGSQEIGGYFQTYFINYRTCTEILEYDVNNNVIDMRVLFTGDFPGNKVIGIYQFFLESDRIVKLRANLE